PGDARPRRVTRAVRIGKEGLGELGMIGEVTFRQRPSVVCPGLSAIDFFPSPLANVIDEDDSRAGLHLEGEWIAQAKCPDRPAQTSGRTVERIVGRNGAVAVEAEHLAEW